MSFGIPIRNGLGVGLLASTSLATRRGGVSFSPASLFAAGEPGAWYDPSDLSTMFQGSPTSSTGLTPVTAVGQSVGFIGDKSQRFNRGAELVPNILAGTSGWARGFNSVDGVLTVSNGVATYTLGAGDGVNARMCYAVTGLVVGRSYEIIFSPSSTNSGGGDRAAVWTSTADGTGGSTFLQQSPTDWNNNAGNQYRYIAPATATTMYFSFGAVISGTVGSVCSIDFVSIKELPGNHLTQSSLSNRPIYGIEPFGGRRNLLTYTEQFDNAAWTKVNASVTPNTVVAPDGTTTADTLTATANGGYINGNWSSSASGDKINSIWIKRRTGTGAVYLYRPDGAAFATINPTSDWVRYSSATITGAPTNLIVQLQTNGDQIDIWGAQGEVSSTATAYQRVVTAFDVTQADVPSLSYLQFDGSDDWLVSPTITPGIDKAQVFAGVRKLSDAAVGVVAESSANYGANDGSFVILAPDGTLTGYRFGSSGTVRNSNAQTGGFTAPITNVLTGIGDIAGDTSTLRLNGTQVAQSTADQGTGNYLAYPLYVGRRGGATNPFNGRIYQMLVRFGANLSAATITQTETFVNSRTGAY